MLKLPNVGIANLTGKKGSYTLEDAKRDQRLSSPTSSGISIRIVTPEEAEKSRKESNSSSGNGGE